MQGQRNLTVVSRPGPCGAPLQPDTEYEFDIRTTATQSSRISPDPPSDKGWYLDPNSETERQVVYSATTTIEAKTEPWDPNGRLAPVRDLEIIRDSSGRFGLEWKLPEESDPRRDRFAIMIDYPDGSRAAELAMGGQGTSWSTSRDVLQPGAKVTVVARDGLDMSSESVGSCVVIEREQP